ncbi:hypothetical protein GLAREA_01844 [Glarea lozoyensis ATCC 20868]|uniref:Purine nucleoside permease n=1 Tax=Glarea lozoyensis (strain ATCC 20868 / MF5171) TaxID=1116229 RepID=S3CHI4_GLAL2|nr:uncharacterized protein GLAREA_01844 [Glarea lozoyensis ATCC 20868]EPE25932.1 hypothetical protein GLAREA_01844 [Glarea lozoyensis ATCC 20868]
MKFSSLLSLLLGVEVCTASWFQRRATPSVSNIQERDTIIAPKVIIITMFPPEADAWLHPANVSNSIDTLLAQNITVPGFAPLYPKIHCQASGEACLLITGEGEINAASTITSLVHSTAFDLRHTYFLISGIAGVNPNQGTLADVIFAKFSVQFGLQYEFDAREMPKGWNTGYAGLGANHPDMYPTATYGTEVFELNTNLRDIALGFASSATLIDSPESVKYRANYNLQTAAKSTPKFKQAIRKPAVKKGDVMCSDVYYTGTLLGESAENTTRLYSNGSATYYMTAQEDNATLEALLRGAAHKVLDFSRVILMRSAANFDRPHPAITSYDNLYTVVQGGFGSSLKNLQITGTLVIRGIINEWSTRFEQGIKPSNYIGDIFGTLGGTPEFGPYIVGNNPVQGRDVGAVTVAGNPVGKGKSGYHAALRAQGF